MPERPRIILIHATRVAIEPIETAAKAHWPEAEMISILEEGLSAGRASGEVSQDALNERIVQLARYAEGMKPDGILFTCSAFGRGIEKAADTSDIPVLKPNAAMFETAFECGNDVAMIYTFAPAVKGMEQEFEEEALRRGSSAKIRSIYAQGALEALKSGDTETHDQLIANAAKDLGDADTILLAHFSMARAAEAVKKVTDIPVFTSPEAAINKLQSFLGPKRTGSNPTC